MIIIPSFRGLVARVFTEESGPESGSLYSWGFNGSSQAQGSGQLGLGDKINRSSPHLIGSSSGWTGSVSGWTAVSFGWRHALGVNSSKLYSWGINSYGQLGLGLPANNSSSNYRSYPILVDGSGTWDAVSAGRDHCLAIKSDNTLWAWGKNTNGQLGRGNTSNESKPIQISGNNWSSVSAGWYHSLAIRTDGSLWAWGLNSNGQLGDFSVTQRTSPVKIKDGTSWIMVSAGQFHSLGIKSDGSLWSWGNNYSGQSGLPNYFVSYSSPMQIVGHQDWSVVSAGDYHSLAIRNAGVSGTLWAWGRNNYGQLGQSSYYNYSSPVQIGGSGWLKVSAGDSHSGAINSNNKMFFWGFNNFGQIGNNSSNSYSSPIAIMPSLNWFDMATIKGYSSFAIKKQA